MTGINLFKLLVDSADGLVDFKIRHFSQTVERWVDAAGALLGRICSDLAHPGLSETAIDPYSKIMIPTSDA